MPTEQKAILQLEGINKTFRNSKGESFYAVRDANLVIHPGETVALVGESGSGKSTLGRIALGLIRPDSGTVKLHGIDLISRSEPDFRSARTVMQPVFQDPTSSLNPRKNVAALLKQASYKHNGNATAYAIELLESVGLRPGTDYLSRMAHELSGGQRQRLAVARALAMKPELIVADEALSGADVSIRGQILNLLLDIREERGMAYLTITHDISVARAFSDRVAVMMRGEIVEAGDAKEVLTNPQHDYTKRLVAAVPDL